MFFDRIRRVNEIMVENEIDYIILSPSENLLYLTGLDILQDERLHLMIVSQKGDISFIIPEMTKEIVQKSSISGKLLVWDDGTYPVELLKQVIENKKNLRIAIDDKMWSVNSISIHGIYPKAGFIEASKVMTDVRLVKHKEEIEKLAKISDITDQVMEKIIEEIEVGKTERQLSNRIEILFKELGADDISFKPQVAVGANASIPHHLPSNKKVEKNEMIILDFGGQLDGYRSDIARTVSLGEPRDEMKKVYEIVKEAQEMACQEVRPGKMCFEIDKIARDIIKKKGYGEYFIHRTGHGIGVDFHEAPFIVENNRRQLEPGMVFSIEPGIYLPGRLGVRIEDIVAVTEKGFRRLNNFTRELIVK
jgi:Xaa-Pro dipeptidase